MACRVCVVTPMRGRRAARQAGRVGVNDVSFMTAISK
jgi:hypothetical protein